MARLEEDINSEILGWARDRAGLSLEKAAKKIGLSSQNLAKMEGGERKPTRRQLYKIAKVYWHPVAIFYLNKLPVEFKKEVDFRSPDLETNSEEQGMLDALIRDIYARQSIVKDILEDYEEPRSFVGSLKDSSNISAAVEMIKNILNLHDEKALDFSDLRERVHGIGVFVLLVGDIGNYHTKIEARIFRGFAIADPIAPFIVINPDDAKTARSFTLVHELTHVMMNKSGISGEVDIDSSQTERGEIEKFCNDVASNFLLPSQFLPKIENPNNREVAQKFIKCLANKRKVSEPMVAYRFWSERIISSNLYRNLCKDYAIKLLESKKNKRKAIININNVRKSYLGKLLIGFIKKSLHADNITYTKAGRVLRVNPISVGKFVSTQVTSKNQFSE